MWTKFGDEFSDEARDMSDAAFRTHAEALMWSNRRGLDLLIPKRDIKRFAETADPELATKELLHTSWWEDRGDAWWIGVKFADWQIESSVVTRKREQSVLTTRRNRMHKAGDHSLCLPKHCPSIGGGDASQGMSRDQSPGTGRDGTVRGGRGREAPLLPVELAPKETCQIHTFVLPCRGCAADRLAGEQ